MNSLILTDFAGKSSHPLDYNETVKLFDPACFDEVMDRSRSSPFFHTFHEFRRASGFPSYGGPPEGSFLDFMFTKYRLPENLPYRVELDRVARWFQNQIDLNTCTTLYEGTAIELERKACARIAAVDAAPGGSFWLRSLLRTR